MKYDILATGSKGNCTAIQSENNKEIILLDAGISFKRIKEGLLDSSFLNIKGGDFSNVRVNCYTSHEHS
ncbi:MAG: hypothetical protein LBT10_04040 [Methanobrevibacter sp.]|jgi:hypothetical protein|nr:hypothetical protein [Methanobrevibacter sp.]